ncbi:MAG: alpha/beta hydrolase [Microbacterium sp.]|jgi:alpha-beta hydrolase superfamily lysophospholipase|uniref:Alpha/beta hydrolase n=1 Tax=Microbacterium ginsengisoli TaxID=400772 RepID=A0A0F0LSE6_9MICO|nr:MULTISPECIES: alpha/beta hydrolase [Microbacterium]KJL36167.1 Alpha/beta hydrolase family protein [Microbacterium ginsengisoli]MAL06476.1 alpha/beta hydrolase [Microbacterium sp.]MCK9919642.1 alpha/beta hydrolase [Microbacteriaceae bacterium K1510]HAN24296.1 alpha/beta hydrolase [Microbacterium ginsengisoli]
MTVGWGADILGDGFMQLSLPLGEDSEGAVVATLVRAVPERGPASWFAARPLGDVDVLYVHGWSDYFFQTRLARFWTSRGARFFALDLRKYGRSLRPGQTPGYVTDLTTYDEDIAAALGAMGRDGEGRHPHRRLVLLGHSTGGLTLSLWADRHPRAAAAVILNSPWLEFQLPGRRRSALAPVVGIGARMRPYETVPQVDLGFYTRAQREVADPTDPVSIDLDWRPEQTMAVHTGWLNAILAGHARVEAGLRIDAPVCVLLSARSAVPTRWSEELTRADSVLVVDDIARAAVQLGSSVTVERIEGALHDVFLSRHDAREEAYARLARWVGGVLARA